MQRVLRNVLKLVSVVLFFLVVSAPLRTSLPKASICIFPDLGGSFLIAMKSTSATVLVPTVIFYLRP
jgi:hypothetical protein